MHRYFLIIASCAAKQESLLQQQLFKFAHLQHFEDIH